MNDSRDESMPKTGKGPRAESYAGPGGGAGEEAGRFARVASFFEHARAAASAEERRAIVAGIADASERAEVERLLEMHEPDAETGFGDEMPRALAGQLAEALQGELEGETAALLAGAVSEGHWEPVREIGRGGMGTVWLAERRGADFRQLGALKILRAGYDDDELVRRFRAERAILARLEHRNIAKFLDGGTTEDGKPFVVMEYVGGVDLVRHCIDGDLGLRERVALFRRVCAAVEYAHASLVVHRDIKPSNILVSRLDGEPKLLDFGIAKLLEEGVAGRSDAAARTVTGMMMLTPEYASPEQVQGSTRITVATDVYALGLVLYEVLTGIRAQRFETIGATELARVVCEQQPPPPSHAITTLAGSAAAGESTEHGKDRRATRALATTTTRRLRRRLSGDLDAIVMRAIRKEPHRRYASVAEFNEDLRRYLEGAPVQARKGTAWYRASRFVRRNRLPLAAAAVLFVVLSTASIVFAMQAGALRTQADELASQRDELRTKTDELTATTEELRATTVDLREQRDIALRESTVSRDVVEFMVDRIEMPLHEAARAEQVTARDLLDIGARRIEQEISSAPLVRASMMDTMGSAYRALGVLDEAERLLGESYTIRREHGSLLDRMRALRSLSRLRRAQGRWRDAIAMADHGRELAEGSDDVRVLDFLCGLLAEKAYCLAYSGRPHEARTTVAELEALLERHPIPDDEHRGDLQYLRARLAFDSGDLERAEALLIEALESTTPDGADKGRAAMLRELTDVYREQGRYERALGAADEALAIDRRILGDDHPIADSDRYQKAAILQRLDRFDEAEELVGGIIERERARYGEHPYTALAIAQLANVLSARGEPARALPLFEEALAMQRETLPEGHREIATTLSNIGVCLIRLRDHGRARTYFEEALAMREELFDDLHPDLLTSRSLMALALYNDRDFATAADMYRQVYEGRRAALGEHPDTAGALYSLASVSWELGRWQDVVDYADASAQMYRRVLPGGTGVDLARPLRLLGRMLTADGRPEDGERVIREALEACSVLEPSHPVVCGVKRSLAETLVALDRTDEARAHLREVVDALAPILPDDHPSLARVREQLEALASRDSGSSAADASERDG